MAYSTQGSTAVSVLNFGARGDGITNDTAAIQRLTDSVASKGGGTVFFPRATYLTSGYINITGNNVTWLGERGARIVTAPSGNYQKINVSGVSGVVIDTLEIDCGRTTGRYHVYDGSIALFNVTGFTLQNSRITHTEGIGIFSKGATKNVNVLNNQFDDYFIGIYTNSSEVSGSATQYITVDKNNFFNCWTNEYSTFSASVKLQNNGFESGNNVPGQSCGHKITNNSIVSGGLLGVELWGYITDSTVSNNTIQDCDFGVSIAAFSSNIVVDSNTINGASYVGIEVADAQNVVVSNNVINGATGLTYPYNNPSSRACKTQAGIISNSSLTTNPIQTNIIGNIIKNCSDGNIKTFASNSINIVGNILHNDALGAGSSFVNQNTSNVNFSNNVMNQFSTGNYFIVLDGEYGADNITIANNDFNGAIAQWGIFYYNNFSTGNNNDNILVENNRTTNVTYCGYGMVQGSNDPTRLLQRNNFGPTGAGYSIVDRSIPAGSTPYGTTNIANGIQYYGNYSYTIPSGVGITGDGVWLCVWSGGGGYVNNVRVKYLGYSDYGNDATSTEFFASMMPYQAAGLEHSLAAMPQGNYFASQILQAKTLSHDSSAITNSLWIKIQPVASGIYSPLNIYYSEQNGLNQPYATYTEPVDTQNNAKLFFNQNNKENIMAKYSYGVALGNSARIYSPSSGILVLDAAIVSGAGVSNYWNSGANATIWNANTGNVGIGTSSPGALLHVGQNDGLENVPRAPVVLSRYWANSGDTRASALFHYKVGGQSDMLVVGVAGDGGSNNSPAQLSQAKMVVQANGNVGIGTTSPSNPLHVVGTPRFDASLSSTATTSSTGFLLIPIGFLTINITGGNFKIPYYNV